MKHTTKMKHLVSLLFAAGVFATNASAADASDYISIQARSDTNNPASATGDYSVAIGVNTVSEGLSALAIGSSANANGGSSIAIGAETVSEGTSSTAVGEHAESAGYQATALGAKSSASGTGATAVGTGSSAEGGSATAVGANSDASAIGSTALGQSATATEGNATALGTLSSATAGAAVAVGAGATASGTSSVATGANAEASGLGSVASGMQSNASGDASVALGRGASATDDLSVALGALSTTEAAVGTDDATVNGIAYSGFAGNIPVATVSVGSEGFERTITNVAAGRITADSTDAVNGSQLYLVAEQVGTNAADIADIKTVNETQDVAIAAAKTEVKAGDNVVVNESSGSNGQAVYTVSANSSATVAGSDYVTVTPSTTTSENGATNTTYTIDLSSTSKQAIDNNTNAINGLNGRVDTLNNRVNDMEKDLRAGIAGATALAFLQRPNEAGKSMVSAAVGGFRDQQALAIGYARNSDNNKWSIKAGVGVNTQKDVNWGGSVGYQW